METSGGISIEEMQGDAAPAATKKPAPAGGISLEEMQGGVSQEKPRPTSNWLGKKPSTSWVKDPHGIDHARAAGKMAISAGKAVATGGLQLGELAVQGYEGVASAILGKGYAAGAEATAEYFKHVHEVASAATGVSLAPADKEEEAMFRFLSVLPEAITAAGDTVYEKTGSALAGAGTQGILTLLAFKPGIIAKSFGGIRGLAEKVKMSATAKIAAEKIQSTYDALAVTNPEAAETIARHAAESDLKLGKILENRAKEAKGAGPKKQEVIGSTQAQEAMREHAEEINRRRWSDNASPEDIFERASKQSPEMKAHAEEIQRRNWGRRSGDKPRVRVGGIDPATGKPRVQLVGFEEASAGMREATREGYEFLALTAASQPRDDPVVMMHLGQPVTRSSISSAFRIGADAARKIPGVPLVEGKLREYADQIVRNLNPEALGPQAKMAGSILAKNMAEQMRRDSNYYNKSAPRRTFWNYRMQEAQDFMRRFGASKGSFADPLMNEAAEGYKNWSQEIFDSDRKIGFKYDPSDNYLYHIFEDGEKATNFFEKKYGEKWKDPEFMKDKVFSLYDEGIKANLKPRYTNPEDIMLARQHASDVAQMRVQSLNDLEEAGLAVKAGKDERPPDFPSTKWSSPTGESYWVHNNAAQVLHNAFNTKSLWTSKGMGGDLFRGAMGLKNTIVPIKLAMSLFHPLHVATIDNATAMVRATKELLGGTSDPLRWIKEMADGARYKGIWDNPRSGSRVLKAWQGKVKEADLTGADRLSLQYMIEGGMVPEMSAQYRTRAVQNFRDAIQRRSAKAIWHASFAAIDSVQGIMFQKWIPSLKIASYLKDVRTALKLDPTLMADPVRRQMVFRKLSKSVDNRYGEMAYNTLFWNRIVKDLAVANTLSLGWQLGFLREYGGGIMDLGQTLTKEGTLKQKAQAGMLDRPLFVTFYTTQALAYGAMMTWAMTGKPPTSLMDYVYPRTGDVSLDGKEARVGTMFYPREFMMIYKHMQREGVLPGLEKLIASKSSGLLGMALEGIRGTNSMNQEIRNPDSPPYKKVEQTLAALMIDAEPISIASYQRSPSKPVKAGILGTAGFAPAPKYITETRTEAAISTTFDRYYAQKLTPYDRAQFSKEAGAARKAYDAGDMDSYGDLIGKMAEKHELTAKEQDRLEKSIKSDVPPSVKLFSMIRDWRQQKAILDKMTPEEREVYLPHSNVEHLRYSYEEPD